MSKSEMRQAIENAMARYDKPVEKIEKVLGENLLNKYTANYRAGSGQLRLGKNSSGKHCMSETGGKQKAFY